MLLSLIVTLIIVGVLLYAVSLLPIDAAIMNIIRAVVVIAAVLYVLDAFGLTTGHFGHFPRH